MKVLEKEIIVSKNDLDELNHVNNIKYVNWILEIAKIEQLKIYEICPKSEIVRPRR